MVAVVLSATACTVEQQSVNRFDFNLFPEAVEWQLGDQLAAELADSVVVVDDEAVQTYIQGLGEELVAHTDLADRPWVFTVIEDPSVNAFAIPGGRVYVHSGLLEAVVSEHELMGVLAHEVAHGEARHATEQLSETYGLVLAGSLVLGQDPGLVEQIAAEIVAAGVTAKFSRDDEREADRLGLVTLAEAGVPPASMAEFFELLLARQDRRPSSVEQFFGTHPLTADRVADVRTRSADITVGERRPEDPAMLARIQQRLR